MTGWWFIDALDSRGGLAVASQREADLMHDALKDVGPSVFISPPAFVPEFLGSRAVGFGLARMQAQTGLFHDETEVSFDSLPAVVEFVRRTYLRGTGGDGPAENGGPPRRPRPIPGRPLLRERKELLRKHKKTIDDAWKIDDGDDPAGRLLKFAILAGEAVKLLGPRQSGPPPPPVCGITTPANAARRLARGGFWVLEELVRRRPAPDSDEFVDWLISVDRLIRLFFRMGLWFPVSEKLPSSDLLHQYVNEPSEGGTEGVFRELIRRFLTGDREWAYWAHRFCCAASDLLDDLVALPAPPEMVPFARPDGQNLLALLSGFIAIPTEIFLISESELQVRCAEIVLFAAAALNLDGETAPGAGIYPSRAFADHLVGRALAWMDGNLPRLVFSNRVENLIRSASGIPA